MVFGDLEFFIVNVKFHSLLFTKNLQLKSLNIGFVSDWRD